jgi:hypothetical protein
MRKTDYNEFILESKLELLLEANIEYTDKFKDILRSRLLLVQNFTD